MSTSTDLKDDELSIGKLIRKKRKEKGYIIIRVVIDMKVIGKMI